MGDNPSTRHSVKDDVELLKQLDEIHNELREVRSIIEVLLRARGIDPKQAVQEAKERTK